MARKIRLLDEHTINKIAAGEVIENSASVIKELVQNSFDAGATEVCIETRGAGRTLIRVIDNGHGMSQDDALLSLERHATSKLSVFDDLAYLQTMGFRGEALPSIAAISRFSLFTSVGSQGHFLKVEGGKLLFCNPVPMERGTKIEVEQLFYNVPVRRRFLSSPEKEEREMVKMAELLALSSPDVKMTLLQNGKKQFTLAKETFEDRIFSIHGEPLQKELFSIDYEEGERKLSGMISSPLFHRSTRSHHFLFINGRHVLCPLLYQAIRDSYSTLLPQGRFPLFFLRLTLNPSEIDVNVHPQKKEVRFYRDQEIRSFVLRAVAKALSKQRTPAPVEWALDQLPSSPSPYSQTPYSHTPSSQTPWNWVEEKQPSPPATDYIQLTTHPEPDFRLIGTLTGYILCEKEKGTLLLVDQKKAHSRILFEKPDEEKPLFTTPLIVPYTFQFDRNDAKKLKTLLPDLEQSGFAIREFGPTAFIVESHPIGLSEGECRQILESLLEGAHDDTIQPQDTAKARVKRARLLSLPSNSLLSKEEAESLLTALFRCNNPEISPDGKPTFRKLDLRELMEL